MGEEMSENSHRRKCDFVQLGGSVAFQMIPIPCDVLLLMLDLIKGKRGNTIPPSHQRH